MESNLKVNLYFFVGTYLVRLSSDSMKQSSSDTLSAWTSINSSSPAWLRNRAIKFRWSRRKNEDAIARWTQTRWRKPSSAKSQSRRRERRKRFSRFTPMTQDSGQHSTLVTRWLSATSKVDADQQV